MKCLLQGYIRFWQSILGVRRDFLTRRIGEDFLGPTDESTTKANMDNGNDTILTVDCIISTRFCELPKNPCYSYANYNVGRIKTPKHHVTRSSKVQTKRVKGLFGSRKARKLANIGERYVEGCWSTMRLPMQGWRPMLTKTRADTMRMKNFR